MKRKQPYLTVAELAAQCQVSIQTIHRLIRQGLPVLPAEQIRIHLPSALAWLQDFTAAGRKLYWWHDYEAIVDKNRGVSRAEVDRARKSPVGVSATPRERLKGPYVRTRRRINPDV